MTTIAAAIFGGALALGTALLVTRQVSLWLLDLLVTSGRSGRVVGLVPSGLLVVASAVLGTTRARGRDRHRHRGLRWIALATLVTTFLPLTALPLRRASDAEIAAFDSRYPGFRTAYLVATFSTVLVLGALAKLIEWRTRDRRDTFALWPRDPSGEPRDDPTARAKRRSLRRATDTAVALLEQRPDIASVDVTWVTGHQHWPVRTVTRDGVEDIDPSQIDTTARQRRRLAKAWARWRVSSG